MNLFKLSLLSICISLNVGYAQEKKGFLSVNDLIPDYTFNAIINNSGNYSRLSNVDKKLIILEFWNFYCSSCIKSFPQLDSLQKQFDDQIQILLVIDASKEATINFFKKHKNIKMPDIPIITEASLLMQRLPSEVIPYSVWIDNDRIIRHITGGYNVTERNIASFLSGSNMYLRNASARSMSINDSIVFFSSLSRCNRNKKKFTNTVDPNFIYISKECQSIAELYFTAYNESGRYDFGKKFNAEFHISDATLVYKPLKIDLIDKWLDYYAFNYELFVPRISESDVYDIMKADLSRYFKYRVSIANEIVKGYSLVEVKTKMRTLVEVEKYGDNYESFFKRNDKVWKIRNQPAEVFIRRLKMKIEAEVPFRSEVSGDGLINIDIPDYIWFAKDKSRSLINYLNVSGIKIEPTTFSMDILKIHN